MTDTKELWQGEFGDQYTARNTGGMYSRAMVWQCFASVQDHEVESILEIGANRGLNLEVLRRITPQIDLFACEPNDSARAELINCLELPADHVTAAVDLVFTQGVLIHVPTDKLTRSFHEIHRVAKRYIMFLEYFAPSEEMIPYRGHDNALWRRDYGGLFMNEFPQIKFLGCTFFWKRVTGLDNLTMWIFEKIDKQVDALPSETRH